jgi:hypothetical protein
MLSVPTWRFRTSVTWAAMAVMSSRFLPMRRTAMGGSVPGLFSNATTAMRTPVISLRAWRSLSRT